MIVQKFLLNNHLLIKPEHRLFPTITFLTKCWGGMATDNHITQNSGFIQLLDHSRVCSFYWPGVWHLWWPHIFGVELEIPSYNRGCKQLNLQEVEHSQHISNVSIHMECVIGLLKTSIPSYMASSLFAISWISMTPSIPTLIKFRLFVLHL